MDKTRPPRTGRTARAARRSAADSALRDATHFAVSPLIECCYALAHVCDPDREASLHAAWTEAVRRKLSAAFWRRFRDAGAWPRIWTVLPDLFGDLDPAQKPERLAAYLRAIAPREFARQIVGGVIHPTQLVQQLVAGGLSLRAAVGKATAVHREWLLYSGLYPFDPAAPVAQTLQLALDSPHRLKEALAAMLEEFWSGVFRSTWQHAQPQYEQSIAQKARLQAACTAQQLADELRLRIEIVGDKYLQAVRGGYRLPFSQIGTVWMIPSAFNTQHFWHVLEAGGSKHPLFPYFDPTIDIGIVAPADRRARRDAEPPLDPAQVFRALADPARYSIMLLLGAAPHTATALAQQLSLSKGTVSHHVHILREAGLVTRSIEGTATLLRLNRATVEQLSAETLRAIDSTSPVAHARSKARRRAGAK
jgi:DNA-binding transcriptional ArsR family regulator